jgi:ankyrin repeat protein
MLATSMPRASLALGLAVVAVAACGAAAQAPCGLPRPDELVLAAARGDAAAVRALLDRGADVDARDAYGDSALMLAVLYGDADLVKLLLDRKADPRIAAERSVDLGHPAEDVADHPLHVDARPLRR